MTSPVIRAVSENCPEARLLVGFSGGMDSTVLLHALAQQRRLNGTSIRAIHVHHGLQADADQWTHHCTDICKALGVELIVGKVNVPLDAGIGLEAAARRARHASFAEHLETGETLVLAHHQDDQAETVLLRLMRASGSAGLAAMRPIRPFGQGQLWRPLLDLPRTVLLAYAVKYELRWIEDSTNAEHGPERNFLRHQVMPVLQQRWPHAAASLSRSAALLAEESALLRDEAKKRLALIQGTAQDTLSVTGLLALKPGWQAQVFRAWIMQRGLPAMPGDAPRIIAKQLLSARPDTDGEYRWAGASIRRWREHLYAQTQQPSLPDNFRVDWDGQGELVLPTGDRLMFDCAVAASTRFSVRARQGGERITLPGRQHSHSLKHALQQAGIAPWQRQRMPLLFDADDHLLAAGDQLISARMQRYDLDRGWHLVWHRASTT